MDWNMKRRWDIYLNGRDGLKEVAFQMVTIWDRLLPACGIFGEAVCALLIATARVLVVIALPFLVWLAPIIAIFTAHRALTHAELLERMRAQIHRNGR